MGHKQTAQTEIRCQQIHQQHKVQALYCHKTVYSIVWKCRPPSLYAIHQWALKAQARLRKSVFLLEPSLYGRRGRARITWKFHPASLYDVRRPLLYDENHENGIFFSV